MLELTNVTKRYGRKTVLKPTTCRFEPGLTLLTGPSGGGKSTLLRLMASAEAPSGGTVAWNALPGKRGRRALRQELGYAPQAVSLPDDLTAREFALHIAALKGLELKPADQQFAAISEAIGIYADINNRIATFSGGMRRRLVFAQALLGTPRLLILDEPTSELDPETGRRVMATLMERTQEAVIVMTSHLVEDAAVHARGILRMENGQLSQQAGTRL